MRFVSGSVATACLCLAALPAAAASTTGTLGVTAIVIDGCALSVARTGRPFVHCATTAPPYRIEDRKPDRPGESPRHTVIF